MNQLVLEKKADEFRRIHGIGSNDCIRLKSLLAKLNVLTVFKPISASFSGMAIKVGEGAEIKRFILVNSKKSLGHQHFTICHELYHLYVQEAFDSRVCSTGNFNRKDSEEYQADVFASFLMLPENGIKALIPDDELALDRISLKTILNIEHYYSCSRSALLYRLKNLKIITSDVYDRYKLNVRQSAVRYGYSLDLYREGNHNLVIGDYGSIARELFDRELISESHYFSLMLELGMNVDEIEEIEEDA